jgi:hypothetical protein
MSCIYALSGVQPERMPIESSPFHVRGRPFHVRGRPLHVRGRPFHVRGRPFHVRGRPFHIRGRPLHESPSRESLKTRPPRASHPQTAPRPLRNSVRALRNSVRALRNSVRTLRNSVRALRNSVRALRNRAKPDPSAPAARRGCAPLPLLLYESKAESWGGPLADARRISQGAAP